MPSPAVALVAVAPAEGVLSAEGVVEGVLSAEAEGAVPSAVVEGVL